MNGIKIDKTRQVDLPHKSKTDNAGATTLKKQEEAGGKYTLQIGSYPTEKEAQDHAKDGAAAALQGHPAQRRLHAARIRREGA